jgi:hypothetical protein
MTTQFTCTGADGTFITYSTADANGRYNVPFTLIPNTAANLNVYLWDATDQEYDLIQQDDADNPWIYDPANNRVDFDGAGPAVGTATLPDGSTQGTLMLARVTDVSEDELAQFTPGSSIRSQDLNDNFNKLGNAIEELHCNATLDGEDFESFYWNKVDVDAGGDTYTSTSTSAWPSNNTTIATTAAGDERWLNATGGDIIGGDGISATEAGGSVTIAVDLATNSGLEFDTGELQVDDGNGIVVNATGVNVGQGTGITVNTDNVAVNQVTIWGQNHNHSGNVSGNMDDVGNINFTAGNKEIVSATNADRITISGGTGGGAEALVVNRDLELATNATIGLGGVTYDPPSAAGSANQVLTTDDSGNLSWTDKTTDTNTTYDLTVPASTTDIRLAGSDGTNDDITITGGTNVTVTRTSATELSIAATDTDNNTTYTLPVTEDSGNAVLTLTAANPASTDAVTITAGNNVTFGTFSAGGFTINASGGGGGPTGITIQNDGTELTTAATTLDFTGAGVTASGTGSTKTINIPGTDTNTTYDLTVPDSTTDIRLAGSDGTDDDVTITGGTNITVTRTSATELNIAGTVAAANDGQINVNAGNGLTAAGDNATANQSGNTTRTLTVGAGTGITVNADDVQLAEIADNRVLGNSSGADAAPTAVQISEGMIEDDAVTADKLDASNQAASRVLSMNGSNDAMVWITPTSGFDFPSGTVMLFFQASAPTGFTQVTTQNNKALRIVSGTGGGTGGSVNFTTAFSDKSGSLSGATVGGTTLTTSQMPSHNHSLSGSGASGGNVTKSGGTGTFNTGSTGGNASHTHSITGGSVDFDLEVEYIDVIIASRD